MAKITFAGAVKKAKSLYKTGRYSKFSDAVKAAYRGAKSVVKKKRTVSGVAKRRKKKRVIARVAKQAAPRPSKSAALKKSLANACLGYELATTRKATIHYQKQKAKYRKALRAL